MIVANRPAEPAPLPPEKAGPAVSRIRPAVALLVGLTLLLAFLAASFAAKNSEVWQRLALGRLIATGGSSFGTDPLCYSTEGRTWVNSSWLADWAAYQLYTRSGGAALVFVKALLVALGFGMILVTGLRRNMPAVFAGCAALGVLACAPRLLLSPAIMALPLTGVLVWLVGRVGKLDVKAAIPFLILGCLWANLDAHLLIAAAFLALYAIGAVIDGAFGRAESADRAKLLGLALLAFMAGSVLNPHHVGVWRLPAELVSGDVRAVIGGDEELAPTLRSGFDAKSPEFGGGEGNPLNGVALSLLAVLAVGGVVANARAQRSGDVLALSLGIALTGYHGRSITVAILPIVACTATSWGEALRRWTAEKPWNRRAGTFAALGLALAAGLACLAAVPGWIQPYSHLPNSARRVGWSVDPEPSLEAAATAVPRIRAAANLPDEARLLVLQPELAHYIAWFSYDPEAKTFEKTAFDIRYDLHAPYMAEAFALRQRLAPPFGARGRSLLTPEEAESLKRWGVAWVGQASTNGFKNLQALGRMWDESDAAGRPTWPLWRIAGRAALHGLGRSNGRPG